MYFPVVNKSIITYYLVLGVLSACNSAVQEGYWCMSYSCISQRHISKYRECTFQVLAWEVGYARITSESNCRMISKIAGRTNQITACLVSKNEIVSV